MKMQNAYIVTGTLTDAHTVTLDESLPLTSVKVRLVVEPLVSFHLQPPYQKVITEIRERQKGRGHQPPTRQEVDTYLQTERDSWSVTQGVANHFLDRRYAVCYTPFRS